ncbi:hypothetical protein PAHAL_9G225100 [Panicum hallii]|uniref:Uncharacterized protein n=1 Tax=Panicum hallii TaxID=206008 RepID=A0A2T8I253_9POAL|nr:hypothetical protein PAHAL_9G225100 [Panicum hallii]PVH31755.1 hypothetical protein PAHAL_9G225100 [Panicum hallii]
MSGWPPRAQGHRWRHAKRKRSRSPPPRLRRFPARRHLSPAPPLPLASPRQRPCLLSAAPRHPISDPPPPRPCLLRRRATTCSARTCPANCNSDRHELLYLNPPGRLQLQPRRKVVLLRRGTPQPQHPYLLRRRGTTCSVPICSARTCPAVCNSDRRELLRLNPPGRLQLQPRREVVLPAGSDQVPPHAASHVADPDPGRTGAGALWSGCRSAPMHGCGVPSAEATRRERGGGVEGGGDATAMPHRRRPRRWAAEGHLQKMEWGAILKRGLFLGSRISPLWVGAQLWAPLPKRRLARSLAIG